MYKFLYFDKWYASGLSLDEIMRLHDNKGEIWGYAVYDDNKVAMHPAQL